MALENYDLEKYEKAIKKESYEEGVADGAKNELEHGICQLITTLQELSHPKETVIQKLQEKYDLSEKEAEEYMKKYW